MVKAVLPGRCTALSGRCKWYWCSEDDEQEWAQVIIINCLSWAVSISFLWYLCIILQVEFTFRHVLDAAIKNLTADGVAWKTTRAEKVGITTDEEKMIWEKGLLRCQMAETLVNTIYFYYGKPFWNSGKGTMATSSKLLIQIVLYLMKVIPKHFMVV